MELVWPGKYDSQGSLAEPDRRSFPLVDLDRIDRSPGLEPFMNQGWENRLIQGDVLQSLPSLLPEFAGQVHLAYLDPPFGTGATLRWKRQAEGAIAYRDRAGLDPYLNWLWQILRLVRDLLHPEGCLFLHLDWRVAHFARALGEEVFPAGFRSSIVWAYGGRGAKAVAGQLPRNHDEILVFARGETLVYHPIQVEHRVPLTDLAAAGLKRDARGVFKTAPRGDYTEASMQRLRAEGRVYCTRNGRERVKYYLETDGDTAIERKLLGDVWTDIPDAMHVSTSERTGYPTQKPVRLLERILTCASNPGDLVLDPFCGSGTTPAAVERSGDPARETPRRWIAIDQSPIAIETTRSRLASIRRHSPILLQWVDVTDASAEAG